MHGWCSVAAWSVALSTPRPSDTSSSAAAVPPTWSVQCMPVLVHLPQHAGCCLDPAVHGLDIRAEDKSPDHPNLNSSTLWRL